MSDARLIERSLPISALGEECARERRSMAALPSIYYLLTTSVVGTPFVGGVKGTAVLDPPR